MEVITDYSMLKDDSYSIIISDGRECTEVLIIDNDYTPCEDNVIIANDENHNKYYVEEEGLISVFNTGGTLIHTFEAPGYWYAVDEDNNPVPMGDYYLVIDKSKAITVSVFR